MVTISPATEFASVPRQVSGESQTFSRTVTANPGTNETIVSTTLTLDREQINLVLEEATLTENTGVILLEDGDFLVLNRTDLLGSDAGDNLLQEIAVDDASLLLEDATNDEDEIQSDTDKLLYEDYSADSEPNVVITNGVTSANTAGYYSRKFIDTGHFVPRGLSTNWTPEDVVVGIDRMPQNVNDDGPLSGFYDIYKLEPGYTDQYVFSYTVTVCFFKTETISETDPATGITTQHEIRQPTECKSFSLTHAVTNSITHITSYVSGFYAPLVT